MAARFAKVPTCTALTRFSHAFMNKFLTNGLQDKVLRKTVQFLCISEFDLQASTLSHRRVWTYWNLVYGWIIIAQASTSWESSYLCLPITDIIGTTVTTYLL